MILGSIGLNKFNNIGFGKKHSVNKNKKTELPNDCFCDSRTKKSLHFYKQVSPDFKKDYTNLVFKNTTYIAPFSIASALYDISDYVDGKISTEDFIKSFQRSGLNVASAFTYGKINSNEQERFSRYIATIFDILDVCNNKDRDNTNFDKVFEDILIKYFKQ